MCLLPTNYLGRYPLGRPKRPCLGLLGNVIRCLSKLGVTGVEISILAQNKAAQVIKINISSSFICLFKIKKPLKNNGLIFNLRH